MATKKARVDLNAIKNQLQEEFDAILAESAPLHKKRDALVKKIQPLEAQLREINQAIKAIEQPGLLEVGKQLSVLAGLNPKAKRLVNAN